MLTLFILLQAPGVDPSGLVDQAWNVNPYGLAVYGALVIVLAIGLWRTYSDLQAERKAARSLADQAMVLMTKLEERLPSVKQFADIEHALEDIRKGVYEIRKQG